MLGLDDVATMCFAASFGPSAAGRSLALLCGGDGLSQLKFANSFMLSTSLRSQDGLSSVPEAKKKANEKQVAKKKANGIQQWGPFMFARLKGGGVGSSWKSPFLDMPGCDQDGKSITNSMKDPLSESECVFRLKCWAAQAFGAWEAGSHDEAMRLLGRGTAARKYGTPPDESLKGQMIRSGWWTAPEVNEFDDLP